ncbi:MAG: hypothetical protein KGK30_03550, partial [Elusimicrobia bacterium]|nr:hypothetical protein [Elusimicrobiota bacterium]
ASGRPLPQVDYAAQWPEGLRPRLELTNLMERLVGWSYRSLARGMDFRFFALLWVAVVSSLSILALYACAESLTRSPPLSLLAAAAYGLSWAAQSGAIASFRLEALGLPLIFASLACAGRLLDERSRHPNAWGAASAAFLLAAYAAWHLSRFYLATYLAALGYAWWRTRRPRLRQAALWAAVSVVAALALLPSARRSLFIASPGSYGHVYGLLWAKLAHGLRHPADPALLSPIERIEWTGPSNSPGLGFSLFCLLPLAAVLLPRALAPAQTRQEREPFAQACDALFWMYLAATVLASRMMDWLAFFLVLAALKTPARRRPILAALLGTAALLEGLKCWAPASPLDPVLRLSAPFAQESPRPTVSFSEERQLLYWLREHAGPGKPTLAPMGLSAEILAYCDTPVLLQPKWEAAGIRAKTAGFAKALFGSEDELAAYAKRYGARLLVYSADSILDDTSEGPRYASGRMAVPETSAAYRLHFEPWTLKRFRLLFQNEAFRVYALEAPRAGDNRPPPLPVYDRSRFGPDLDVGGFLRRRRQERLLRLLQLLSRKRF